MNLSFFKIIKNNNADQKGIISKDKIGAYLPPNPVIVEAGAHVGVDTVEMARLWEHATIHAFEPVPKVYAELKKNVAKYKNVKTYKLALSNKTGKTKIFVSGGRSDGSSSLLKPKDHLKVHPDVVFDQKVNIKANTIGDWAKANKVKKVDFFWLDMQGLELDVMKASEALIKKASVIYTEVSLIDTYEGVAKYPELKKWLESIGFSVAIEKLPWKDIGNVLFVKRKNS